MSVEDHTLEEAELDPAPIVFAPAPPPRRLPFRRRGDRAPRPRVRKRRVLAVLAGFLALAGISTVFGMLTAIASDLPQLENRAEFKKTAADSFLYDDQGRPIGVLAPPSQPVFDHYQQISRNMINAIVAVEDKTFWSSDGIDLHSIVRASLSDITGGQHEGASTIPEEFVKNVLAQENNRTILEKLREAGMAFELVKKWTKPHIMTEYLNSIYFGNGGYGVESAARVYFGLQYGYDPEDIAGESRTACGDPDEQDPHRRECADMLDPAQAALLAAMVANPTAYDPILHPAAAMARRNYVVLPAMLQQHYITRAQYERAELEPLPTAAQIEQPQEPAAAPYFTSWVRPLIIRALEKEGVSKSAAQWQAYYGGLKVHLTLDEQLQLAAQDAVNEEFPIGSNGPTASLVSIQNSNGEVRAMVSGDGVYAKSPFNLATLGYRQPGSAFKLFTLAAALSSGQWGPDSVVDSEPIDIPYTLGGHTYHFDVHNFDNAYDGPITLATATAISDNSVFTQVGMSVGTDKIRRWARRMGIRSSISTTPAMIIGGLTKGVSALDMAHAYETVATGGLKVYNPILGDVEEGPIGIQSIEDCKACATHDIFATGPGGTNRTRKILTPDVAATITQLLEGPVDDPYGTGTAAAIPGVAVYGKTGTTSNYVDAWFCGWTKQLTTCVWVGYPSSGKAMTTNFDGQPVEGGTYPAIIWHNFTVSALGIIQQEQEAAASKHTTLTTTTSDDETVVPQTSSSVSTSTAATTTSPTSSATTTPTAPTQTVAGSGSTGAGNGSSGNGSGSTGAPGGTVTPAPSGGAAAGPNGGTGLP